MPPGVVLSRSSPYNVPKGYVSVAELPAALPGCHFEHPAGATVFTWYRLAQKYIDHFHYYALAVMEFSHSHLTHDGRVSFRFRAS